jgi:hypothetical protein
MAVSSIVSVSANSQWARSTIEGSAQTAQRSLMSRFSRAPATMANRYEGMGTFYMSIGGMKIF